jgi:hypothetical protein
MCQTWVDATYQALSTLLGFIELNKVELQALDQTLDQIVQRGKELSSDLPVAIREKIETQNERLNTLRHSLERLLRPESEPGQFFGKIADFRDDYDPGVSQS